MKFHIEDSILKIYSQLPHKFKAKDIRELTNNKLNISYQLLNMRQVGLIKKIDGVHYSKVYPTIVDWIKATIMDIQTQ